jgi:hypothetical protein
LEFRVYAVPGPPEDGTPNEIEPLPRGKSSAFFRGQLNGCRISSSALFPAAINESRREISPFRPRRGDVAESGFQQAAEPASARKPRGVIVSVGGHQPARPQGAEHGAEDAPLVGAGKARPRQAAQDAVGGGVAQVPQMLVQALGGIVDDMRAGETPFQVGGELGIDFDREEKRGGKEFFLDRAREGAGAGPDFDHDPRLVQPDVFDHALGEPGGAGHNGAGQSGCAQKHFEKFRVFVNHRWDCFP